MLNTERKLLKEKSSTPNILLKKNHPAILIKIYDKLLSHYGPRKWWPAKTRFEVIAGAILTQNVSWHNAKTAVDNLKRSKLLSPSIILKAPHRQIAGCIKSSRFYNQKTKKLKTFCNHLIMNYNGSLDKFFSKDLGLLRKELLNLNGIGKETADSILLYAGKKMTFVVDAYSKRLMERYGIFNISSNRGYDEVRALFMRYLPEEIYVYNEYHALIVHHCYAVCKSTPNCKICPIFKINEKIGCSYGGTRINR